MSSSLQGVLWESRPPRFFRPRRIIGRFLKKGETVSWPGIGSGGAEFHSLKDIEPLEQGRLSSPTGKAPQLLAQQVADCKVLNRNKGRCLTLPETLIEVYIMAGKILFLYKQGVPST